MSGEANGHSQAIGTASSASPSLSITPPIEKDPDNIDVRLRLLHKNNLIPDIPYLCTVPSNREYKRAPEEDSHWIVGNLFHPSEEKLQYMSYLFRDPDDGLMIQMGDWDKKDQAKAAAINARSGTATPFSVKKRMTLSDYHNKPKASTAAKAEPIPGANGVVNGVTRDIPKPSSVQPTYPHAEKRPAEAMIERQPFQTSVKQDSPQPAKKLRKSPPPTSQHRQPIAKPKSPERTLPKSPEYTLPPLISPTLPPVIEAELLKYLDVTPLEGKEPSHNKQSTPPKVNGAPSKREAAKKELGKQDLAAKTLKQDSEKTKTSLAAPSKGPSDRGSPLAASVSVVSVPILKPEKLEVKKKDKLIVKLKYGKRNKMTVQRLLNLGDSRAGTKDRQKRDVQLEKEIKTENAKKQLKDQKAWKESRKADTKENEDGKTKDSHKVAEKRPRTATEEFSQEPTSKRQKVPAGLDIKKAKTPMTPSFKSPTLSTTSSAQKDQVSTPKRTVQNTASASMRRVGSSDTHVRTPQAPPGSTEKTKTNGTTGSSSMGHERRDGNGNTETDYWREEQAKYSTFGRDLKRETDPILKGEKAVGEAIKRAAIAKALDAMNCFMLAFTAENKKFGEPNPGWRTMLQYCNFVMLHTRKTAPPLYGLAVQLTAVCREMLSAFDIDRLEKTHLPFDNPRHQEDFAKFKNEMVENMQEMKRLWGIGQSTLSIDDLRNSFPRTWEGRARGEKEKLMKVAPRKYAGPYHLPLSSCSSSLEAVRFAHSLLKEWCRNEKVEFDSRIVLT